MQSEFKVFVGNLPPSVTQLDLETLFAGYGTLLDAVVLPLRGSASSQRCGFVKYSSLEEANAAIGAVNGMQFGDTGLVVRMAAPGPKSAFGIGMPQTFNRAGGLYGGYQAPMRGYGRGGAVAWGAALPAAGGAKLFVGNIPNHWQQAELEALFGPYGGLQEVILLPRNGMHGTQCGFVTFSNEATATTAIQGLNGASVDGESLIVRHANKARMRPPMMMGAPPMMMRASPMMMRASPMMMRASPMMAVGPMRARRPYGAGYRPY